MATRNYRWSDPAAFDALARLIDAAGKQNSDPLSLRLARQIDTLRAKGQAWSEITVLGRQAVGVVRAAEELEASSWMDAGDPKPWQRETIRTEPDAEAEKASAAEDPRTRVAEELWWRCTRPEDEAPTDFGTRGMYGRSLRQEMATAVYLLGRDARQRPQAPMEVTDVDAGERCDLTNHRLASCVSLLKEISSEAREPRGLDVKIGNGADPHAPTYRLLFMNRANELLQEVRTLVHAVNLHSGEAICELRQIADNTAEAATAVRDLRADLATSIERREAKTKQNK